MNAAAMRIPAALLAAVAAALAAAAHAGDEHARPAQLAPAYRQECGACHLPYPPAMLPAASWQRLMGNLQHHFGADASLDAATTRALASWVAANAGTSGRVRAAPPEDRITRSAWFVREHHEVPAAAWQRPAVKSTANCSACHARAAEGDFDEHRVRIPR